MLERQEVIDQRGGPGVLMIDLLRRAGDFERAMKYCEIGLSKEEDEVIATIIRFEKKLVDSKDTGSYTIDDGMKT